MWAPHVIRQTSRRWSHLRQTLSSMSCVTFSMAAAMHLLNPATSLEVEWSKHCPWRNPTGHTVRCRERGGHVHKVLSAAVARPIHRLGRCRLRYPLTTVYLRGRTQSYWKTNPCSSSSMSIGINQFSNMTRYTFPLIAFSAKNGPNKQTHVF